MIKVKICGITNLTDAKAALRFGADEIGFNFFPDSPRYILPHEAANIAHSLGNSIGFVGVFVNESVDKLLEAVQIASLDTIQLHGDETPKFISFLRLHTDAAIIKAFRVSEEFQSRSVAEYSADAILLDAYSRQARGGTGETFDWAAAAAVKPLVEQLYLAGGLTPMNVAAAIAAVRPYAVDVASGVESDPGKKDLDALEAFIRNAKNA